MFTVSILGNEQFNFDLMQKTPMASIDDFLEDETPDYYTVRQPSMLKKITTISKSMSVPIIKDYAMTITCKQMRCPNSGVIELEDGGYRYLTERNVGDCKVIQMKILKQHLQFIQEEKVA